jgi:phytoene dehydrogenase-like protein
MADKSISIIGAGIAGLSTGCYGQMNGYRTRIFEQHVKAGGLCTGWQRKGYTIGTSGWVAGSGPTNNDFCRFWQELGAAQRWSIVDYEEYARIEGRDAKVFILYADIDRLEQHMYELAPEDKDLITAFIKALRAYARLRMPMDKAPELYGLVDKFKMVTNMLLPFVLGPMGRFVRLSIQDFAARFKNPFMREVWGEGFPNVFFFDPGISLMMVLNILAGLHLKSAGYPRGGSLELVHAIEQRYLDLGGRIQYRAPVTKIVVENNRAVGVRLGDGTEHHADYVISAADGRTTLFDMLEGRYTSDEVRGYYDTLRLFPPILFISLGVNRTFEKMPASIGGEVFPLDEPLMIAGKACKWLAQHTYTFDPSLAPEGKTLIRVMLPAEHEDWADLRKRDRDRYKAEKEQIADQVIRRLDQRYPGLANQVEMCDVATPATFERYTGAWQGCYLGWLSTPEMFGKAMSKTLPGLAGFYMVGQWVYQGSLAMAAASGRQATQIICHKDQKPFVTTVP